MDIPHNGFIGSRGYEFLYPTSRQFPFDIVCYDIVKELEKRNWSVPGIEVDFDTYGSGEQNLRRVSHIKGRDFKLWFCRGQRTLPGGHWNDTAAVTEIIIPGKELHIYEDESGPTLYVYVGSDYERDRGEFMNGSKVNNKLYGKPKMFLQYRGECHCDTGRKDWAANIPHTHPDQRPPLLVHYNDLDRQYDPEGNEPREFVTADIMEEFRKYLRNVVLEAIMAQPVPQEKIDIFARKVIPFPEKMPLFCFADSDRVERIRTGKRNKNDLEPHERYAMSAGGYRLIDGEIANDGTIPEIAYQAFLWCGMGEIPALNDRSELKIGDRPCWDERGYILKVNPSFANDIYIADHGVYEARRAELEAAMGDRRRFTGKEVADFMRARARTIVPIHEYKGGFNSPVVLIARELGFQEVEIAS